MKILNSVDELLVEIESDKKSRKQINLIDSEFKEDLPDIRVK